MSETKTFQRNAVAPPLLIHITAGMLALNGVAHLIDRQWVWGALDLAGSVLGWVDLQWLRRTPLVRIDGGEVIIRRSMLLPARRFRVDAMTRLDISPSGAARLVLRSGRSVSIPVQWFAWNDRARFLSCLQSMITPVPQ